MELVYLWVEEYKNIHRQGFNFSPRFRCDYNPDTNELTIDENEDYIPGFFGENINVTAIVGKNGSGKSSVFEILSNLILKIYMFKPLILSFLKNGKLILLTNIEEIKLSYLGTYEIKTFEDINNYNLFSVFYSSNFTNGKINALLELFTTPFFKTHTKSDMESCKKHGYENDFFKNQSLLNAVLNSNRIIDEHPSQSGYMQKHAFTIQSQFDNYEIGKIIFILHFFKLFGKSYLPLKIKNDDMLAIEIQHNIYTAGVHEDFFIEKITKLLKLKTDFHGNIEDENIYFQQVNKIEYQKSYDLFMELLVNHAQDVKSNEPLSLNIEEAIRFIDIYLDLYRFNRNLKNSIFDFKFKNLSSGEENLILMFALLERGISSYSDKDIGDNEYNILLMLDEIENNFHPQWQKRLFIELIEFLNLISRSWKDNYGKKLGFSILLNSHSPFMLSNLPKENVIFLDTYKKDEDSHQEEGNCKNVTEKIDINPFGANIHTLLNDGFFMKDGLMGEFAKRKINEIIDFHKEVEKIKDDIKAKESLGTEYEKEEEGKPSIKTRFWHTQSIIGDAYLKQVVKNHLVDVETILLGKERAKQEEIKRLRDEADRLEKLS